MFNKIVLTVLTLIVLIPLIIISQSEQVSLYSEANTEGKLLIRDMKHTDFTFPVEAVLSISNKEEPTTDPVKTNPLESIDAEVYLSKTTSHYLTTPSLNVRSGPGTEYEILFALNDQEPVEVGETYPGSNWAAITHQNKTGFVSKNFLTQNKPAPVEPVVLAEKKSDETPAHNVTKEPKSSSESKAEDKTKDKPDPKPVNMASTLTTIDSNQQLILVTNNQASSSAVTVETFERDGNNHWVSKLKVNGFIGYNGFASDKREGDGKTPIGKFTLGKAFGTAHNPGAMLPYQKTTSDDVWVDDPESPLYNTWQSKKETKDQWTSAEDLMIPQYKYAFVINYNTSQTPYKGSAIFFHVANRHTAGCIGVSEAHMVSILKWLNPSKHPVIIQAPANQLNRY